MSSHSLLLLLLPVLKLLPEFQYFREDSAQSKKSYEDKFGAKVDFKGLETMIYAFVHNFVLQTTFAVVTNFLFPRRVPRQRRRQRRLRFPSSILSQI